MPASDRPAGSPRSARRAKNGRTSAPSPWGSAVPTRETQRRLKEEALYETAARWFNMHGFHGTSLADLASELGITKAALYHYVRDKSELLYRLHIRSLEAADAARRRGTAEGRDGLDRIRRIVHYYVASITSSRTFTFVLLEDGALDPAQAKEILDRRRWLERDLRRIVVEGIEDGSITRCDPKLVSLVVGGAMNSVAKWFRDGDDWDGEQVAVALSAMLARMLSRDRSIELAPDVAALPTRHDKAGAAPDQLARRRARA